MENIGNLLYLIMQGMQREFDIYGHTISLWQIFMFVIVSSIVCKIIRGLIYE